MAINPITAQLSTRHVTAYDARKMIYGAVGPWPHRCAIDAGASNFDVSVNEENSLYYDIAPGIIVYHGYVIANDKIISQAATAAASGKYKKATVYMSVVTSGIGIDQVLLDIDYSGEDSTAASVSFPTLPVPENDDYIITDTINRFYYIPFAHLTIYGSVIQSTEQLLPVWNNKQFYAPGDSIDLSYNIFSGYIAASGANVYFFIPFAKALSMVSGATLSGSFTIRHADGGFIGSSSGQPLSDLGTVTITPYESGAYVRCVMGTPSALTNQAPLSVLAGSGAQLTFN